MPPAPDRFREWLASGKPIVADGAMGTMLHARGVPFDVCFDELNLSQPELLLAIHWAYLEAGAQIIETNSFGANRHKLAGHGLADQVVEINAAAVALARRAIEETGRRRWSPAAWVRSGSAWRPSAGCSPNKLTRPTGNRSRGWSRPVPI